MATRRTFIKKAAAGSALLMAGGFPYESLAAERSQKLTILHTNDVHSHLEPFPMDGGKYQGQGGVAQRAALVEQVRREEEHVLLFDAGDIFQGTPYFNLYKGEPEIKAMSMLQYDASTMGNHDFDAGIDGFAKQLPHANFPILIANYDFTNTPLEGKTAPYTTIKKGKLKIGVFGLGIELHGLVPESAYGNTKYIDPVMTANTVAEKLKKREHCDMVICLSHLGYQYDSNKISDMVLAKETDNIDLIIGGHTHTFLDKPVPVLNKSGKETMINQVGWAGLRLGRLDYVFDSKKSSKLSNAQSVIIIKQTRGF
ncbi:MAG: metallophosphatase [Bacteroidetes bacterium 46-16]|nr:MAG: metallophosphatase [Bacteroidetes bacterium 46-16]